MNVLVIAPHPDDETLGCGGAILLHRQQGDRVTVVFLTSGELGLKQISSQEAWAVREEEARLAANVLGIERTVFLRCPDWFVGDHMEAAGHALRPILAEEKPDLIYLPHPLEWHPDHKAAFPVLQSAFGGGPIEPPELRLYEVWTPLAEYDHVEDITAVMPRKLEAVRCYASQIGELHYDRAVEGLNRYRGEMAARKPYAEVFRSGELQSAGLE